MQKLLTLTVILLFSFALHGQTVEEWKTEKAEKEAQIAALQGEVNALKKKIESVPGWKLGAFGTLGLNFSSFNNWLGSANPDTYSSTIGFSGNAFANLLQEKYFWRNAGNLNIAKTKLALSEEAKDDADYETTADVININSLFGYKISDKLAASVLGEYRSTFLSNFNNPGFLDLGVGGTWTPISNMVVVFHPLNYNFVFAESDLTYESSLGCKVVADYSQSLPLGVSWRSNLSTFISYSDTKNYSNWTWVNGFSFNVWKGIGVGFELGLRGNRQEGYNAFVMDPDNNVDPETFPIDDLDAADNPLQSYWLLGITYRL